MRAVAVFVLVAAVRAGIILVPLLLPCLPDKDLSVKGFVLGSLVSLPFISVTLAQPTQGGFLHGQCGIFWAASGVGYGLPGTELHRLNAIHIKERREA